MSRIIEIVREMRRIRDQPRVSVATAVSLIEPLAQQLRLLIGNELASIINESSGERVGNLEEKRAVARALNDLVDTFGLRIKCPKTGQPAILLGATRGDGLGDGRFQLLIPSSSARPVSSSTLPDIELMLRDPRAKGRENHR